MNCKQFLILCLTTITLGLVGCSSIPVSSNALKSKEICQTLKRELSTNSGHNINIPNDTPIERVRLYRQYQHYNCDEVLHTQSSST